MKAQGWREGITRIPTARKTVGIKNSRIVHMKLTHLTVSDRSDSTGPCDSRAGKREKQKCCTPQRARRSLDPTERGH